MTHELIGRVLGLDRPYCVSARRQTTTMHEEEEEEEIDVVTSEDGKFVRVVCSVAEEVETLRLMLDWFIHVSTQVSE